MKRLITAFFAVFLAVFLGTPGVALACPQCAGREDGGVAIGVILGLFIFLPFAVVGVVYRYIRSEPGDASRADSRLGS
jgi:ABC-type sulfate transport system permease component